MRVNFGVHARYSGSENAARTANDMSQTLYDTEMDLATGPLDCFPISGHSIIKPDAMP